MQHLLHAASMRPERLFA